MHKLVVTVAAAHCTTVKKIKPLQVYVYNSPSNTTSSLFSSLQEQNFSVKL